MKHFSKNISTPKLKGLKVKTKIYMLKNLKQQNKIQYNGERRPLFPHNDPTALTSKHSQQFMQMLLYKNDTIIASET